MLYRQIETPIGPLLIAGETDVLAEVRFPDAGKAAAPGSDWTRDERILKDVEEQLCGYFAGQRTSFDLRLNPSGTSFQRQVLDELLKIPFGETSSYSEIATRIGRPAAVRAVGAANGRNPIPIIIPCHRVIGKNGKLTGFAGGLELKQRLLELESGALPLF